MRGNNIGKVNKHVNIDYIWVVGSQVLLLFFFNPFLYFSVFSWFSTLNICYFCNQKKNNQKHNSLFSLFSQLLPSH